MTTPIIWRRAPQEFAKFLVICISIFAGFISPAFANCESEVLQISDWSSLPLLADLPLKEKFVIALKSHPIAQRLRAKYGIMGGANLNFELDYLEVGGWKVQAVFLTKVLRELFPKAKFGAGWGLAPHVRNIKIKFTDTVSDAKGLTPGKIAMSIMKAANPGPELKNKVELRRQLNLPLNARIAHIYDASDLSSIRDSAVRMLLSQGLADIVIVSTRNPYSYIHERVDHLGDEVHAPHLPYQNSSDRPKINVAAKPIIFNSTKQRMPMLFAASDYGVVLGRGNIYEAAAEGRPIYLWADAYQAESDFWSEMIATVMGTYGAHVFTEISSLPESVRETSGQSPVIAPWEVRLSQGKSALDRLLERIEGSISGT